MGIIHTLALLPLSISLLCHRYVFCSLRPVRDYPGKLQSIHCQVWNTNIWYLERIDSSWVISSTQAVWRAIPYSSLLHTLFVQCVFNDWSTYPMNALSSYVCSWMRRCLISSWMHYSTSVHRPYIASLSELSGTDTKHKKAAPPAAYCP